MAGQVARSWPWPSCIRLPPRWHARWLGRPAVRHGRVSSGSVPGGSAALNIPPWIGNSKHNPGAVKIHIIIYDIPGGVGWPNGLPTRPTNNDAVSLIVDTDFHHRSYEKHMTVAAAE